MPYPQFPMWHKGKSGHVYLGGNDRGDMKWPREIVPHKGEPEPEPPRQKPPKRRQPVPPFLIMQAVILIIAFSPLLPLPLSLIVAGSAGAIGGYIIGRGT